MSQFLMRDAYGLVADCQSRVGFLVIPNAKALSDFPISITILFQAKDR